MTAAVVQQVIAAFALHALWQVPALAVTTWLALRIGKPNVRMAHTAWVVTLVLCVCSPALATWQGYREARVQNDASAYVIRYGAGDIIDTAPRMQRDAAWLRVLHKHLSPSGGVTPFGYTLPRWLARDVACVYLTLLMLACVRLGLSNRRARMFRRQACSDVPQHIAMAVVARAQEMRCRPPAVACSDAVAGPMLVGMARPALLLPRWAGDLTPAEVDAVLAHELAHLRRRDPAAHAVCSLLLLPVQFHPAASWIAARIRQTREMACDAAAAEQMGSTSRYAHALLRVAERVVPVARTASVVGLGLFDTAASVRDGRLHTATQAASAGLELFGAHGAMEERMHTMVTRNGRASARTRLVRGGTAVLIAVAGVTTAWSVRVQPALAAQATPQQQDSAVPLVSGHAAQQQLQEASHRLRDVAANAATDEERKKIGAAQQAIRMAETELAQSAPRYGLDGTFQLRMDELQNKLNSPEFKARMDTQLAHAEAMRLKFDSPEFKARIQKQMEDAQRISDRFNSPEFKARMEKQLADTEAMRQKFDSPEFKELIRKQAEDAQRMSARVNTLEFRARIAKQVASAEAMRAKFDSPEFKAQLRKQVEEATRSATQANEQMSLMAKNDSFKAFSDSQRDDQPVRVSSGVMAAANLTKAVPVYPASAKEAKVQGEVVLHVIVDEYGAVEQVSVVSSPDDALTKSATDAVKQWTYKPFLVNGRPRAVDTTVTVHYTLAQ